MSGWALVTGASRGIGAATARVLAADGYKVIVHYASSVGSAEDLVSEIVEAGGEAVLAKANFAEPKAPFALAEQVAEICGGKLDALVLNAGTMIASPIRECSEDIFDTLFNVNLRAPFFLLQQLAPTLVDGGSVVFVSSLTANKVVGAVAGYASMKASLEVLVKRGAKEFSSRSIRVNAVAPGTIASPDVAQFVATEEGREMTLAMQALKRIGQPEDVADVISFLCSDKARWIDGAVIPVDGGVVF